MTPDNRRKLQATGAVIQGILLGILLTGAFCQLLVLSTNAHVFRYQGF